MRSPNFEKLKDATHPDQRPAAAQSEETDGTAPYYRWGEVCRRAILRRERGGRRPQRPRGA